MVCPDSSKYSILKRLFLGLLLLGWTAVGGSRAFAADSLTVRLSPSRLNSWDGWIAADLDGDHRPDLARSTGSRHDGALYLQEIRISFSAFPVTTVLVRTSVRGEQLIARDLDGDADRDLVVEGLDRQAVAVLLNDGDGHFHQGRLEDYQFQLSRRSRRALESSAAASSQNGTSGCPPTGTIAESGRAWLTDPPNSHIATRAVRRFLVQRSSPISSRGPPSFA